MIHFWELSFRKSKNLSKLGEMKMRIRKLFFLISKLAMLIGIVMLGACIRSKAPMGVDHEIRVVADSTVWSQTAPLLREIFERVEYNPQPEKHYILIPANMNNFKRFKNILFISTLDATDEISQSINASLSEEHKKKIAAGNLIFVSKEQWANPQLVMFLVGPDMNSLKDRIENLQAEIFNQFEDYWNKFHEATLYKYKELKDVERHLLRNYGWTIRLPIDFRPEIQSASDRFIMFKRQPPLRWMSVFWIDATDPSIITKEWCIAKRNEIGRKFYENEIVEEQYEQVTAEEVIFLNRRALKLKGLWKSEEKVAGGPFRMYCFFDQPTARIYFIDMHVFSPDFRLRKMHYLRQMDIIAKTFRTNLEIKLEDIK